MVVLWSVFSVVCVATGHLLAGEGLGVDVDAEVLLAFPREVPQHLGLDDLGEQDKLRAVGGDEVRQVRGKGLGPLIGDH